MDILTLPTVLLLDERSSVLRSLRAPRALGKARLCGRQAASPRTRLVAFGRRALAAIPPP